MFSIDILPQLKDNYSYILRDEQHNITCVVDPSTSEVVIDFLEYKGWKFNYILNTHHHHDHIGGNEGLKKKYKAKIVASTYDKEKIPSIDILLSNVGEYRFPSLCKIFHIPGHTLGHIAYYFAQEKFLFTGDTLFSIGCGRLFEGTPQQMLNSLNILASLPPDTEIYPGHEYTLNNIKFALEVEPDNQDLIGYYNKTQDRMLAEHTTIPSDIATELQYNPFLKAHDSNIKKSLNKVYADDLAIFTELRKRKDNF